MLSILDGPPPYDRSRDGHCQSAVVGLRVISSCFQVVAILLVTHAVESRRASWRDCVLLNERFFVDPLLTPCEESDIADTYLLVRARSKVQKR